MPEAYAAEASSWTGESESMRRTCPRDRTPLAHEKIGSVVVDRCPKCRGAFFDAAEVGRLTKDKELAKYLACVHGAATSPMVCPACGGLMDLDKVDGVEMDHCTSCLGVWLDAGELDRLKARGEGALSAGFVEKGKAAEERRYREMPRGGGAGRFAALGHSFRNIAWAFRRKK